MIRWLLAHGADAQVRNAEGRTVRSMQLSCTPVAHLRRPAATGGGGERGQPRGGCRVERCAHRLPTLSGRALGQRSVPAAHCATAVRDPPRARHPGASACPGGGGRRRGRRRHVLHHGPGPGDGRQPAGRRRRGAEPGRRGGLTCPVFLSSHSQCSGLRRAQYIPLCHIIPLDPAAGRRDSRQWTL